MTTSQAQQFRLVLVPAVITLAVTVLRLFGELQHWPAPWFSTASGGGGAAIGIVWLVPVFGAWFGWRLTGAGNGPVHRGRALALHVLAIGVYLGGFQAVIRLFAFDTSTADGLVWQILAMGAVSVLAMLVARPAWPDLFGTNLLYALCARVPTALITYLAVFGAWGTHFEKFGPKDYAAFEPWPHAALLAFAQLVFWTGFTITFGGLFGTLASILRRRPLPPAALD